MNLYFFIITPLIIATLIYILPVKFTKITALLFQCVLVFLSIVNFLDVSVNGDRIITLGGWQRFVGITLKADRLSSLFLILTSFLFLICFIFVLYKEYMNRLFSFLFLVLEALIIALFLSMDLFNIYILTEISTITVSLLIMFKRDSKSVYDGIVYLMTNIVGMTFFLLGVGFIYKIFGCFDIEIIREKISTFNDVKQLQLPFAFLMTGIGLKCAVMPVFSWLPKAHGTPSAPSIVSAILSALYIKCGIYLFIRIRYMFLPAINMDTYFIIIGIITGVIGFILAISQTDIKLILAYSTISQIGLILIGLCAGNENSYIGSIYHIFNHAIFKALLFLTAGIIAEHYGTRNIREIKDVFKRMPLVAIAAFMAILGITGAPLFNGSISKVFIQSGIKGSIVEYFIILINLGTIICFIKYSQIFKKDKNNLYTPKIHANTTTILQKTSLVLLGLLCLFMGILGPWIINYIFDYHSSINFLQYLEKSLIYIVSLTFGYGIYKLLLVKTAWIKKGLTIEMSFNTICLFIGLFFTLTYLVQGISI